MKGIKWIFWNKFNCTRSSNTGCSEIIVFVKIIPPPPGQSRAVIGQPMIVDMYSWSTQGSGRGCNRHFLEYPEWTKLNILRRSILFFPPQFSLLFWNKNIIAVKYLSLMWFCKRGMPSRNYLYCIIIQERPD